MTSSANGFNAFISYSQRTQRLPYAARLQRALSRFGKPWYRLRAARVFRDTTTLSNTPSLWASLQKSLDSSEYLIFLASEAASGSQWVAKEVEHWKKHRGPESVLIVLLDGVIAWDNERQDFDWDRTNALPPTMAGLFDAEPLYSDLTWAQHESELDMMQPRFQEVVASLASVLHGRPKDELIGEDIRQHARTQKIVRWTVACVLTLVVTLGVVGFFAYIARKNAAIRTLAAQRSIRDLSESTVDVFKSLENEGLLDQESLSGFRRHVLNDATSRMRLIAKDLSDDPQSLRELAEAYILIADQQFHAGLPRECKELYEIALNALSTIVESGEAQVQDAVRSVFVANNLARAEAMMGNLQKSKEIHRRNVERCEQMLARWNNNVEVRRQLAVSLANLAQMSESDEKEELLLSAVDIERGLCRLENHPLYLWFKLNHANTLFQLAEHTLLLRPSSPEALQLMKSASAHIETAINKHPQGGRTISIWEYYKIAAKIQLGIAEMDVEPDEIDNALNRAYDHAKAANSAFVQEYGRINSDIHTLLLTAVSQRFEGRLSINAQNANALLAAIGPLFDATVDELDVEICNRACQLLERVITDLIDSEEERADREAFNWLEKVSFLAQGLLDQGIASPSLFRLEAILLRRMGGEADVGLANRIAWALITSPGQTDACRDAAIQLGNHFLESSPTNADLWNTLAYAQLQNQEWQKAIRSTERSMKHSSDGGGPWDFYITAVCYAKLEESRQAVEWFIEAEKSLAKHPEQNHPQLQTLRSLAVDALPSQGRFK